MCCLLFYSTDYYDVVFFNPGVIQQGALCHASMGSYGLDTKTSLSVNDITAITPEIMLLFAFSSLLSLFMLVIFSFLIYTFSF